MHSRRLLTFLFHLLAVMALPATAGGLVVVVNARSGVEHLSRDEVVNIFMGRYRILPTGVPALPVDQPVTHEERSMFYRKLVGKELAEINAYWARLIFSGKTSPPKQTTRGNEVVEWIANHAGAVGYLNSDQVDGRMTVVLELD